MSAKKNSDDAHEVLFSPSTILWQFKRGQQWMLIDDPKIVEQSISIQTTKGWIALFDIFDTESGTLIKPATLETYKLK